jgi:putative membrane protein
MNFDRNNCFKLALDLKSSVIRDIKSQVLLTMVMAAIITIIYTNGYPGRSQPILTGLIPVILLVLLLVFQTNEA